MADLVDEKRYKVLDNILNYINGNHISLSDAEIKRNNVLLNEVTDRILDNMKTRDVLFKTMFQTKYYGGSFYDNLKVGEPSEFDLDCLLCLPKIIEPTIEKSDKPGYVKINIKSLEAMQPRAEAANYTGLSKLLDGTYLSTTKFLAWTESLMRQSLNAFTNNQIVVKSDDKTYTVIAKLVKSGPASTLQLSSEYGCKKFKIDIDLVPCFKFIDQWPENGGYRKNPCEKVPFFFVVPKSPDGQPTFWRLSLQEQEKELIKSCSVLKPCIRLLKQLRDRHDHKIASYYIKTVFLWEIEKVNKDVWTKPLGCVFMMMLDKYTSYVGSGNIPYYWNSKNNLIEHLNEKTYSGIAGHLRRIKNNVDRTLKIDPYTIAKDLISPEDYRKLLSENLLGKKYQKLMASERESMNNGADNNVLAINQSTNEMLMKIQESNLKMLKMMEVMSQKISILEEKVDGLIESDRELKKKISVVADEDGEKLENPNEDDGPFVDAQIDIVGMTLDFLTKNTV